MNDLSGNVKVISTKRSTKNLINGYSILKGAKYFAEDGSQNNFIFEPLLKYKVHKTTVN